MDAGHRGLEHFNGATLRLLMIQAQLVVLEAPLDQTFLIRQSNIDIYTGN